MSPKGKITKPLDVYVRVSRVGGREGDSFISPAVQEERCRALATARDYRVGEVLTDLDKSGGTMDRPALNEALARIRSGVSGGIIVARIDRFARTMQGALNAIEEIEEAGGFLIEADGEWDTSTSMGRFGRDLVLRISQLFREQATEGWATARSGAVERGIHGGSRVPTGYRRNGERRLVVDPRTSPHVAECFAMRMRGASWGEISDYLHAHKIVTSKGGTAKIEGSRRGVGGQRWSDTALRSMIANRCYLGEARSGEFVMEGAHEAIVDDALFRAANAVKGSAPVRRGESEGALLAGLLYCACGGRLTSDYTMRNGTRYRYYTCKKVPACPERSTISASIIEPYATDIAFGLLHATIRVYAEPSQEIEDAVLLAESELAEVESAHAQGDLSALAYGIALEAARNALEAAQEARAAELAAASVSDVQRARANRWVQGTETYQATWDALSVTERREAIRETLTLMGHRGYVVTRGRGRVEDRVRPVAI